MTKLSVNINKIATLRNSRGGSMPSVADAAINSERFGAEGITVHPRPDERHITYEDARQLGRIVTTEYNIEGNPIDKFIDLVLEIAPTQVTLVPDADDAITSNSGWDTKKHLEFLREVVARFKGAGIRVSIFLDPELEMVEYAAKTGTDRIELYTEPYAIGYPTDPKGAIAPYVAAAKRASELGMGINAGHDLSLENLEYFARNIPNLDEVSIGHALISDAIYLGLENAIQLYRRKLQK